MSSRLPRASLERFPREIVRLQTCSLTYTVGAVFLGFILLPLLVTLTYGQVFRVAKEPMLSAFATGKLIIVLPMPNCEE